MSDKIKASLIKLDRAIDALDGAVERKAKSMKMPQQDMFGVFSPQKNKSALDTKAVARKLDRAIERVEELLKEGV